MAIIELDPQQEYGTSSSILSSGNKTPAPKDQTCDTLKCNLVLTEPVDEELDLEKSRKATESSISCWIGDAGNPVIRRYKCGSGNSGNHGKMTSNRDSPIFAIVFYVYSSILYVFTLWFREYHDKDNK